MSIQLAQKLIDDHRVAARLEGDDETILYHLIFDLLDWCDHKAIDFDATVSVVREDIRAGIGLHGKDAKWELR